ncbi:LysR family transcriptional regulator [Bradyrhizobium sp. ISRA443]|uniref:LysR family transcriptional regulator n=1 Tax=unclassified Bradyrhizobium TaxID=2631580 RepID=UPI002479AF00|nr:MULTISPECIES: LysR family transcriptional regulator [unclassified Bradyrhizobium]WGR93294.1 LysR family transcriptional regulator [Bradyrhizobium sp. ISRA435]WGR97828.1 LysR family transcriptional regulator [Bradyrhizobium sp. ISRA436]WGS04717.1 LysR family transcriptional regulator [Bradyrhizobium sp. ISRA437]WGS11598.1 LysR family transcriptional regulator [Bradyrhizobium sp. ISRA443]
MRFKGLDLNLLVALDSLMTERNLTAAARRINLSQPAMSAAVARLRAYFRDDLFAMSGRTLVPTPRAEALAGPVREALLHIQLSVISREAFNPAQSERRFRISLSDFVTLVFFRRIVERVAQEAPTVSFELLPVADDHDQLLRRGEVDFLIFPDSFMSNGHPKAALFEERLVCVGCHTNKRLSRRLTLERYMSIGQVAVGCDLTRKPSIEEYFLLRHGLKRRVDLVVQSFSMIPAMLIGTDRIGMMPLRLVKHFEKTTPLRIVTLPFSLPAFTEAVQWPALHNSDPASIWMRDILLQEASCMSPPRDVARASKRSKSSRHLASAILPTNQRPSGYFVRADSHSS